MSEYAGIMDDVKGNSVNYDRRTLCEVLRTLFDEAVVGLAGKDDELLARMVPLIEEAYGMGIKLVKRLVELKIDDLEFPFEYGTMPDEVKTQIEALRAQRAQLVKLMETHRG